MTRAPLALATSIAGRPTPPAAPRDQRCLAGLDLASVDEGVPDRATGDGQGGGHVVVHGVRAPEDVGLVGHHLLRQAADPRMRRHPVAEGECGHLRADLDDAAGAFHARRDGEGRAVLIFAFDHQ